MTSKLTVKDIRNKFKNETGKNAMLVTIKESSYLSGIPKKNKIENYNSAYVMWLENLILQSAN